jgi:hypothetical protein
MKKILIILFAAIFCTTAFAQNENADAVFEKISKTYTLNEDGSISYQYFKQLKLNTYVSFNRLYGETFIIYDPNFQELKINEAYTIMADGKKIVAPENAFNEVLPRGAAHSATFNHLREMVVTHTGLELGATIYLDYTLTTKAGFWPALMADEVIQESSPVNEMEIIVNVPADVELYHKMFNLRTAPEIMVKGNKKEYKWIFKGVEASGKEGFRGELPGVPRLSFSTEKKPGVVFDWITRQKAFDYRLTDEMKNFATGIKDETAEIKTLLAIQEEVVNNMKTDRASLDWTAYRVRTPEEVWNSNGGNELEKAILLSALLKAVGFNATPVLVAPAQFYDKNIGNLMQFHHAGVMVNTKTHGTIYLSVDDMNDQSLAYTSPGNVVAPLYKNADFSIIEPTAARTSIELSGELKFSGEMELAGNMEVSLAGAANPFLVVEKDNQKLAGKISGGIAKDVKVDNANPDKLEASLTVSKDEAVKAKMGYYGFNLPEVKTGFSSWHISYLNSSRADDFVLPFTLDENYSWEIEIPEGYEFVNVKNAVNLKNKAGAVKIEISPKNNKVVIKRELSLNTKVIQPHAYPDFRELINEWLDDNMKVVVFRKAVD